MSEAQKKAPSLMRDPKAGCAIMLIAASIFGGLIALIFILPFMQADKMDAFTQTEAAPLSTAPALPTPPAALSDRLSQYQVQLEQATAPTTLRFTTAELNDAIRSYEEFTELQGTFEVAEITPEEVRFNISFALNRNPFAREDQARYLNGVMYAVPAQKNDEIILKVSKIESKVGEVPSEFVMNTSLVEYRVMAPYSEHPVIGRAMFACENITLESGALSITIDPAKYKDQAAVTPPEDNSDKKFQRRVIMPITSFIMIVVLFIIMVKRRNKKEGARWKAAADREE